jgi:hypothetical protein
MPSMRCNVGVQMCENRTFYKMIAIIKRKNLNNLSDVNQVVGFCVTTVYMEQKRQSWQEKTIHQFNINSN